MIFIVGIAAAIGVACLYCSVADVLEGWPLL